jgi:hypothetical protein
MCGVHQRPGGQAPIGGEGQIDHGNAPRRKGTDAMVEGAGEW